MYSRFLNEKLTFIGSTTVILAVLSIMFSCSSGDPVLNEVNKIIDSKYGNKIKILKEKTDSLWQAYHDETDLKKKNDLFAQISLSEENGNILSEVTSLAEQVYKNLPESTKIDKKVIIGIIMKKVNPNIQKVTIK